MSIQNLPIWHDKDGKIVACTEKIKVMQENVVELIQTAKDAFEDGILMGIDKNQIRNYFISIIKHLDSPYKDENV